ncbi:MAG: hypothetical protein OXP71_18280 [Candidatus Poribacteria bacterium]|nr:hypothetical protein [Candidatus Poribacteria bacterium]
MPKPAEISDMEAHRKLISAVLDALEAQTHDFLNITAVLRDIMEIAPSRNDISEKLSETQPKKLKRAITSLCRFDIDRVHNRCSAINSELIEVPCPI